MEEVPISYPVQQKNRKKINLAIVIGIVLVLVAVFVGITTARQPKKTEVQKDLVVEKEAPTPTVKPKIEKSSVKIQVVNGTGTPGQAGVVVKALEEAGYSTDNIKSGNAEEFDTLTTTITGRADFEEIIKDIQALLKPTFDEITVKSSNLGENSEFDIVVVTGGKIFEEVTPTATSSPTLTPAPTP